MNYTKEYIIKKSICFTQHQKSNKEPKDALKQDNLDHDQKKNHDDSTLLPNLSDSDSDTNDYTNKYQSTYINNKKINQLLLDIKNKILKYQTDILDEDETNKRKRLKTLLDEIFQLAAKNKINSKNNMFQHLQEMLEQTQLNCNACYKEKNNIIKYIKYRERAIKAIDIFSSSIFYYFLANVTNTMLLTILGVGLLSLGVIGSMLLNPVTAIVIFFAVGTYLTYRHLHKPENKKNLLEKEIISDYLELEDSQYILMEQTALLLQEVANTHEFFTEELLHDKDVTMKQLSVKSPLILSTYFIIGNITSTISLTTNTLSIYGFMVPSHILAALNYAGNLSFVTKDFMYHTGVNPLYAGIFLLMYIPAKIIDYFKYEKKHKKIHKEISKNKIEIQHTDFIIKLNESLNILNRIQLKTKNEQDDSFTKIIEETKTKITQTSEDLNNTLNDKLNNILLHNVNFEYSNLGTLDKIKSFTFLKLNNIKLLFQTKEEKNIIKNLNQSITNKLNELQAINKLKPSDLDFTEFNRKINTTQLQIDSLNKRIRKISKDKTVNIDYFSHEFINLINNNFSNMFAEINDLGVNINEAILTYFHYVDDRKLQLLYDIVNSPKPYNTQYLIDYFPEILHVVEQELNLNIAYKTSKLIEHNYLHDFKHEPLLLSPILTAYNTEEKYFDSASKYDSEENSNSEKHQKSLCLK
tara:strand:+ start:9820 stop:11904 length:2085 start_codon:yes stop_codon:yes gene_type:complete